MKSGILITPDRFDVLLGKRLSGVAEQRYNAIREIPVESSGGRVYI